MANKIILGPGGVDSSITNKVMVGDGYTGDLTTFNGKIFVIDLENLPYIPTYGSMNFGGKTYQTVIYPTQEWTTENLLYINENIPVVSFGSGPDTPKCSWYRDDENYSIEHKYNLYYNAASISIINQNLTNGWHVSTYNDWTVLLNFIGITSESFETSDKISKLRSTNGWFENQNGTNEYGLNLIPAGWKDTDKEFKEARLLVDGGNTNNSYTYMFDYNNYYTKGERNPDYVFPIRLVRNLT